MDTYLLWALNALFQELFDPQLSSNGSSANSSFQSFLTPAAAASSAPTGSYTAPPQLAPAPASLPIPEGASASVQSAIQSAAATTGLSPALLRAVASVESGLNSNAVSSAGAVGLMQLMPQTAQGLGVNPDNVAQNALGGAEYLKSLLGQFNQNLSLALAAYNAGPGAVMQYKGIPPYAQTQNYVSDVLSAYKASGSTPSTPAGSSWTG